MIAVRDDTATTNAPVTNPARDDAATIIGAVCGVTFTPEGRQRHCSTRCRQTAWRRRRAAPVEAVVAKSDTVYVGPGCDARYLGSQRCDDCNAWCRRLGPGGLCPCCDEPVAIPDLLTPEQLAQPTSGKPNRRR